jgi:hypothetical protein
VTKECREEEEEWKEEYCSEEEGEVIRSRKSMVRGAGRKYWLQGPCKLKSEEKEGQRSEF